ncbi:tyrosine-type recombinase/integrase [Leptolyngbya sp. FACHB-541]|uniref:tyrosine-type recombinase/integrase n=1 Tax=Leptolyngbya sp. FACHB-541 TaxID=2692810 RepID=UPI00168A3B4C|nr:tyrosine-type recombinase/integrase [Leptolyngbya sp. FACHB-541]MBD1995344.1 tyrosine-type recombinase/integrase [Leptolyngbya sp. FACHB-541]
MSQITVVNSQISQIPSSGFLADNFQELSQNLNPVEVYLEKLSPGSVRSVLGCLNVVAGLVSDGLIDAHQFEWHRLSYHHSVKIFAKLRSRYKPRTYNKIRAAFRRVLEECWRLGLMSVEEYHRAADVPCAKVDSGELAGREISPNEATNLFKVCGEDARPAGIRDTAILALMYGGGPRRSEVVGLNVEDFTPSTGALNIRKGKGGKTREVYLPPDAIAAINRWLDVRSHEPGALFCPISRGDNILYRRMSAQAIYEILSRRVGRVNLMPSATMERCSPHDFRRTAAGNLLDAGVDLATTSQILGHAQVDTTAKYDRRGKRAKQSAAQLISIPLPS